MRPIPTALKLIVQSHARVRLQKVDETRSSESIDDELVSCSDAVVACTLAAYARASSTKYDEAPPRPEMVAEYYRSTKAGMQERVLGHDAAVARLALAATRARYRPGELAPRVTIAGPSGCGKTTLVRSLAESLGRVCLVIDASTQSEVNWHGTSLVTALEELYEACEADMDRTETSVVLLDELDKLAVRPDDRGTNAGSYRRGKQESLLAFLGGGTDIRIQRYAPPPPAARYTRPRRCALPQAPARDALVSRPWRSHA